MRRGPWLAGAMVSGGHGWRHHVEALAAATRRVDVGVVEDELAAESVGFVVHDGSDQRHQCLAVYVHRDAYGRGNGFWV